MVTKTDGYLCSDGEFFESIEDAYRYEYGLAKAIANESLKDIFEDEPVYVHQIINEEKYVIETILSMRFSQEHIVNAAIENMEHDAWLNFKRMIGYEE